jgi:membrane dipeptidase
MTLLSFVDHAQDPAAWASELGISREAVELYFASDVFDLHVDSFIWRRVFGYRLDKRHGHGLLGARFYSQVDFPRALEAGFTGATWVITTNPLRSAAGRARAFVKNLQRLRAEFRRVPEQFSVVKNVAEYREARAAKKHAAFIGIQGGNALDRDLDALDLIADDLVLRITLVHLSSSRIGTTSSPLKLGAERGLSDFGRAFIERLNEKKILVDLAHISKQGFWDAVVAHDKSQPLIVTHTGVSGVFDHWRNLDDDQLRAIASSGGTVGVMFQSSFLGPRGLGETSEAVVRHLAHVVDTVGEDHASLGSDWDGAIVAPRDMPTCLELPRLVEHMLRRGWSAVRIQKILALNALRTIAALRG